MVDVLMLDIIVNEFYTKGYVKSVPFGGPESEGSAVSVRDSSSGQVGSV